MSPVGLGLDKCYMNDINWWPYGRTNCKYFIVYIIWNYHSYILPYKPFDIWNSDNIPPLLPVPDDSLSGAQLRFISLSPSSTVLHHVVFGCPHFSSPPGVHQTAVL